MSQGADKGLEEPVEESPLAQDSKEASTPSSKEASAPSSKEASAPSSKEASVPSSKELSMNPSKKSSEEFSNEEFDTVKKELNLPIWDCEWKDVEEFSVGDSKNLVCHGEYIDRFIGPVKILVSDKRLEWSLYPLEVISAEHNSVTLLVTSYKAGNFSDFRFVVMGQGNEGMTGFEVPSLSWEVQSVIKDPQNPQGYGPSRPIYLSLPEWLWWGWGLALVWFLFVLVMKSMRSFQRRNVIRELSTYKTPRSPYHQYHWEMRKIGREYQSPNYIRKAQRDGSAKDYLSELDKTLRLYFIRQFQVPALDWTSHQITEEIKNRHKLVFKALGPEVKHTIREFEKAARSSGRIGIDDCRQFHQMSYRIVERIREVVEP